ncbi:MAG: transposase [Anaeromyxobacteraceae bacterium]
MREQAIAASRGADGWLGPDGGEAFDLVEDRDGDGLRGREGLLDQRRRSAVDGRTVRHSGYEVCQRIRKRVEEIFGWTKTVASFRKTRFRGQARTQLAAHLVAAAYSLLRLAKLMPATP